MYQLLDSLRDQDIQKMSLQLVYQFVVKFEDSIEERMWDKIMKRSKMNLIHLARKSAD